MIKDFKGKLAQDIYDGVNSKITRKVPVELHDKMRRLLDQLNAATKLETLRVPPSNRLEKLSGNLKDYWSLRINRQWRLIFKWKSGDAISVNIVDYH